MLHPEAQELADHIRRDFKPISQIESVAQLERLTLEKIDRAIADFTENNIHNPKPTVFLVVCDCLSYYPAEDEMEDHCSISDLGDDTSYLGLAYLSKKVAEEKVKQLNAERHRHGAENDQWDYYVLEVTPDDA
jgi:hypothetical protein